MPGSFNYALAPWEWHTGEGAPFFRPLGGNAVSVIDFRNDTNAGTPNQSNGYGLFAYTGALPDGAVPLGSGYIADVQLDPTPRSELRTRLGLSRLPAGATLVDGIADILTNLSDETGVSGVRPLMPSPGGGLEIVLEFHSPVWSGSLDMAHVLSGNAKTGHANRVLKTMRHNLAKAHDLGGEDFASKVLGGMLLECGFSRAELKGGAQGKKAQWKQLTADIDAKVSGNFQPKEPTTQRSETFPNNAASIQATAQNFSWTHTTGGFSVSSASVYATANFNNNLATCNTGVSSANHYCSCGLYGGGQPSIMGPLARASTSAVTGYTYAYNNAAGSRRLYKFVSGAQTQLSTNSYSFVSGQTYKCRPNASTIAGTINGGSSASVTDTSITGNYLGGLYLYSDTNNHTFNWLKTWLLDDELNGNAGVIHLLLRGGNT